MQISSLTLLIVCAFFLSHSVSSQQQNDIGPKDLDGRDIGHFQFEQWGGKPLTVYYSFPPKDFAAHSLILVLSNNYQQPNLVRDQWSESENLEHTGLIFPDFRSVKYPELFMKYPWQPISYLWNAKQQDSLAYAVTSLWKYSEAMLDLPHSPMQLFGNGSGARFLQRMLLFNDLEITKIVLANPSWFTSYQFEEKFPLGLKNTKLNRRDIVRVLSTPTLLLLGELDHQFAEQDMPDFINVASQGPTRVSRGFAFHRSSHAACFEYEMTSCSRLEVIQGASNSSYNLIPYALEYFQSPLDY